MKNKAIILTILLGGILFSGIAAATTASQYVQSGRAYFFDGTLDGIRNGYAAFDAGMKDPSCPDCATDRELIFFHAISRIMMWAVKDNGAPVDSAMELAKEHGVVFLGSVIMQMNVDINWKKNRYDSYDLPSNLEQIVDDFFAYMGTNSILEIDAVLAELNKISQTPGNLFRVYLTPAETQAFIAPSEPPLGYDLEVDYTDVVMLKGILSAIKAGIRISSAYDLDINNKQDIWYKLNGLNEPYILNELFLPNPDFLKVLPTANNPADGKAILAQARQDWITAINYYLESMNLMWNEDTPAGSDPQDDELFYLEPEDRPGNQKLENILTQLRDSLFNQTAPTYDIQTMRTYNLSCCGGQAAGQMELVFDMLDNPQEGDGDLSLDKCVGLPVQFELDDVDIYGDFFDADIEGNFSIPLVYDGVYALDNSPSVLFTPTTCQGGIPYQITVLPDNLFSATGNPTGFRGINQSWTYTLPFAFPFFGTSYSQIDISTNGFISFGSSDQYPNSLDGYRRIQPMGMYDVSTAYYSYNNIYVSTPAAGQLRILWNASRYGYYDYSFALVLFSDGSFRFDYSPGNYYAYPVVGISGGGYQNSIRLRNGHSWGYMTGTISSDRSSITDIQCWLWGDMYANISGINAALQNTSTEQFTLDLNPLYGSTRANPNPISPRDCLPEFDPWGYPLPKTMGHGLGNDPTLGGIVPGKTYEDWYHVTDEQWQPAGDVDLNEVLDWQKQSDWVDSWSIDQVVFVDEIADADNEDGLDPSQVMDIDMMCLGYDWNYLHGAIFFTQLPVNGHVSVRFIHSPYQEESDTQLMVYIELDNGQITAQDFLYGYNSTGIIETQLLGNCISFRIPLVSMPSSVFGRFIEVDADSHDASYSQWAEDGNKTHLRIAPTATVSGTVQYDGYTGSPIYVQIFTDSHQPEDSAVCSTMISSPGAFQLDGIGYGFKGYIRASTPLFGLGTTEGNLFEIETIRPITIDSFAMQGVNIVLNNPETLKNNIWATGLLDPPLKPEMMFGFDAIAGKEYTIELQKIAAGNLTMVLYGRNGKWNLSSELLAFQPNQMVWRCSVNGRYYIGVQSEPGSGMFKVRFTTPQDCPLADISGCEWQGVRDCVVDLNDFSLLAKNWLEICNTPYWCDDSDYNKSRRIDTSDVIILVNDWLTTGL